MMDTEKILELLSDLTAARVTNTVFSSYSSTDGMIFKIETSTKSHFYEDENEILTVRFCMTNRNYLDHDDSSIFEDNLEELVNKSKISHCEAVLLMKRINSIVFEVITDIYEYDNIVKI